MNMHWKLNKLSPYCQNVIWQDELYHLVSSGHVRNYQVLKSSKVKFLVTTHFTVPLQCLCSNFLTIFLYAYILALNVTNSGMIFPPSFFFNVAIAFFFFPFGSSLLSWFKYLLVQKPRLNIFRKKFLILFHTQSCLCSYGIALTYFLTSDTCSHSRTHTLMSQLSEIMPVQIKVHSSWSRFFPSLQ